MTDRLQVFQDMILWCMAVGGAWVDLSCVDSDNERDYRQLNTRICFQSHGSNWDSLRFKQEEEGSNNRSVMSFRCSGLHARYNVRINETAEPKGFSYSHNT